MSFRQGPLDVSAHVYQKKADVKNVGLGESKFLEGSNKVLTIENPHVIAVSGTLGLDYYMVVLNQFGSKDGMKLIIDRAVNSEYIGTKK